MAQTLVVFFGLMSLKGILSAAPHTITCPEQVHIALTEKDGEMRVTWVCNDTIAGRVSWADQNNLSHISTAVASQYTYTAGEFNGTIFSAVMTGLESGRKYRYQVLNGEHFVSKNINFDYSANERSLNFLSYGDMGVKNSWQTTQQLAKEAATGDYQLVVNVGDTSYADDYAYGHNAYIFDEHFRNVQSHAAVMPFMAVPGNHEAQYKFAGYLNRLPMPNNAASPFYYSFDYGPVHFLVYSSEHPFGKGTKQLQFIEQDLAAASTPTARARTPWLVMWSHRPLFCSDLVMWENRCLHEATEYRGNIEALMIKANVDLHISGHNHQYERSYPVSACKSDYTGCNITKTYHNPPHTVYVVNGAGGDTEGIDPTWVDGSKVPFRAFHSDGMHTGYARVRVNESALDWSFVYSGSDALPGGNRSIPGANAGKVIDHFVITKT